MIVGLDLSTVSWKSLRRTSSIRPPRRLIEPLTRSVAMELAPYGVTANAVCPGNTLTGMVRRVSQIIGARDGLSGDEWLAMRVADCPLGRLAQPWEMAGVVAFLASEDARYLTGQAIEVDGGMVMA